MIHHVPPFADQAGMMIARQTYPRRDSDEEIPRGDKNRMQRRGVINHVPAARAMSCRLKTRAKINKVVLFDKKCASDFTVTFHLIKKCASDFTTTFYLIKNARGNPFKTYRYTYSAPEKLHVQLKYAIIFGCFCKYT
ncbi:hypothetical protein JHU38_05705 [Prevotella sp. A2931]|uniref:Uncharacterized protein n=1 Tax=Prevotella illustrans TaxID=2800387 RepID=A0ABS3M5A0_9BACT|nr:MULTISPECIES: hypothetical protein [Prevotella]MBO1363271.1 hypothetical protein [Prevotella illustrans]